MIESNIYYVFEGINQYTSDFLHLYLGIPNNKLQFIFYSQANDIIIYWYTRRRIFSKYKGEVMIYLIRPTCSNHFIHSPNKFLNRVESTEKVTVSLYT